ncbi:YqaJ viral recombinase family protein [Candidatus Contendibacter odensensis]|uniref:YqaJ viral recombinase domain-containing protein n=1 Tax=Candidatus Contendobacter odensis Run_B_J11 TaxID=1400861 RepID=A0A7U7J5M6_9GAMM|nr:YqaJ viral recombinase family protein [Candidatus Contendobacter odensis]CDH46987.1 hypothetical protein BN874_690037 [Candidatus Contendobacter odensis Run_B_J11]
MSATAKIDIAASHQTRLGCSKIAQALGVGRYGTAYQLWENYTGRAPWPNIGGDLRVALGEPMEEVLRPFVEKKLGRILRRDRQEYLHPTLPLIGHVDYRAGRAIGELQRPVVDMKTSLGFGSKSRFGADGSDEVDADVMLQMQGYLMLTGAQVAYVAALVMGPELKIYTVEADPEVHQMIEAGVAEFWWHVTTDTPPAIATLEDTARCWPKSTPGTTVQATPNQEELVTSLNRLKAEISAKQGSADAAEMQIKAVLGDAEALIGANGKPICTWKSQSSTRLDTTALKEALPDVAAQYTKTTQSRVFRLAKEKKA